MGVGELDAWSRGLELLEVRRHLCINYEQSLLFVRVVNGSFFLFRMDEVKCSAVSQRQLSL